MNNPIILFLQNLDLSSDEITLISLLIRNGSQSASEICSASNINRIKVYRILASLKKDGLIYYNPNVRPTLYSPPSIDHLTKLVEQKRNQVQQLATNYINTYPLIEKLYQDRANEIKVIHYTGRDQARELVWNSLQAKKSVKSFGYRSLRESLGYDFLVKWWNEMIIRKIPNYMIANPETYRMKSTPGPKEKAGFLPVEEKNWQQRYFEKKELLIINETFIYNDVFSLLHWDEKNIFGVEIHHPFVARQQEYMFDDLWKRAKTYKD